MRHIFLLHLFLLLIQTSFGQDPTGVWEGNLELDGDKILIRFNITSDQNILESTMDIPDQKAQGLVMLSTRSREDSVFIDASNIGMVFQGKLSGDEMLGSLKQSGVERPLNMKRTANKVVVNRRMQEPVPPYSYASEDIFFENASAEIKLGGTLTIPNGEGPFPAAVLISGSGAQDRNSSLMGHRPFLVLADHLTKQGIAVLRFDDRGYAKSGGVHIMATSEDFASDASAAMDYLLTRKEIDSDQIGFIGHSEGGMIAPMIHAERPDVAYLVLLAGTAIPSRDILLGQVQQVGREQGASKKSLRLQDKVYSIFYDAIIEHQDAPAKIMEVMQPVSEKHFKQFRKLGITEAEDASEFSRSFSQTAYLPWFRFFVAHDPSMNLKKISIPTLGLFGQKDTQVLSSENASTMKKALEEAPCEDFEIFTFPGHNHMFQHAKTGSVGEYEEIEETFSIEVMEKISQRILKHSGL